MNSKNLDIEFDIEPLLILTDVYYDYFIKNEVISIFNKSNSISKETNNIINDLLQKHCLVITNNYISKNYLTKLNHFITDDGVVLFIFNRLYSKVSES